MYSSALTKDYLGVTSCLNAVYCRVKGAAMSTSHPFTPFRFRMTRICGILSRHHPACRLEAAYFAPKDL
jgi:hypothetical protein